MQYSIYTLNPQTCSAPRRIPSSPWATSPTLCSERSTATAAGCARRRMQGRCLAETWKMAVVLENEVSISRPGTQRSQRRFSSLRGVSHHWGRSDSPDGSSRSRWALSLVVMEIWRAERMQGARTIHALRAQVVHIFFTNRCDHLIHEFHHFPIFYIFPRLSLSLSFSLSLFLSFFLPSFFRSFFIFSLFMKNTPIYWVPFGNLTWQCNNPPVRFNSTNFYHLQIYTYHIYNLTISIYHYINISLYHYINISVIISFILSIYLLYLSIYLIPKKIGTSHLIPGQASRAISHVLELWSHRQPGPPGPPGPAAAVVEFDDAGGASRSLGHGQLVRWFTYEKHMSHYHPLSHL